MGSEVSAPLYCVFLGGMDCFLFFFFPLALVYFLGCNRCLVYVLVAWSVSKWDGEADSGEDIMGQSLLSWSRWHSVAFVADRHPHLLCSNLREMSLSKVG